MNALMSHASTTSGLAWRTARHNEISQSLGPQTAFRPETISGVCASRSATCFPARCVGAAKRRGSLLDESKRFRRSWATGRSEEHTSELQYLMRITYTAFCLKKKTKTWQN